MQQVFRKSSWSLFKKLFVGIILIAIAATALVDFIINRQLTWSLIVLASVVFAGLLLGSLFFNHRNKVLGFLSVFTLLIVPFLWIIETVINQYLISIPIYWLTSLALPITGIWLIAFWTPVVARKLGHVRILFCLALLFLLSMPAVILTNMWANEFNLWSALAMSFFGLIGLSASAGVCAIGGFIGQLRKA